MARQRLSKWVWAESLETADKEICHTEGIGSMKEEVWALLDSTGHQYQAELQKEKALKGR